jgi:hypothetical protein
MPNAHSVRRGVVEALVIVSSVLLAFWIDAAWDGHQAQEIEAAMFASVTDALDRNQASMGQTAERLRENLDRIDRFYRASAVSLLELPQDSVVLWVAALNSRASFNGDLEAISMLLGTPALNSGGSLSLRGRLASWRNNVDEVELLGEQLDQAQIRVRERLARYAARSAQGGVDNVPGMAARLGGAGLMGMREDADLMAAVLSKAEAQRLHLRFLENARQDALELLDEASTLSR